MIFETILEDVFLEFSQERKKEMKKISFMEKHHARASKWAIKTEEVEVDVKVSSKSGKFSSFHSWNEDSLINPHTILEPRLY